MRLWPQIVLGWPFVVLAWIFLILSLRTRRVWAALVGALFSAGFCYYLWLSPALHWLGPVAFAGTALAAVATAFEEPGFALAGDLPYFAATVGLLVTILLR